MIISRTSSTRRRKCSNESVGWCFRACGGQNRIDSQLRERLRTSVAAF